MNNVGSQLSTIDSPVAGATTQTNTSNIEANNNSNSDTSNNVYEQTLIEIELY